MGNGQKREYPVLFWPKTEVPENNSGRECCWPYLIGRHPLSPVFGQRRPGTPGNSYFAQLPPVFGYLCSFPVGYSTARIDQHGPQEQNRCSFLCVSGQRGTIAKSMHEEHMCVVALTSMERGTQFFPLASYRLV